MSKMDFKVGDHIQQNAGGSFGLMPIHGVICEVLEDRYIVKAPNPRVKFWILKSEAVIYKTNQK